MAISKNPIGRFHLQPSDANKLYPASPTLTLGGGQPWLSSDERCGNRYQGQPIM